MKNEAKKKRTRYPNYSPEEKTLFLSIVHKDISTRVPIIVNQKTDVVSSEEKSKLVENCQGF
jgi:hypothetical protein